MPPFPTEEVLPMLAMMCLRLGVPMMFIFMLGTLAQRIERLQV